MGGTCTELTELTKTLLRNSNQMPSIIQLDNISVHLVSPYVKKPRIQSDGEIYNMED